MEGVVLEKEEFAYLLATLHAASLIGVEDPELFPAPEAQDAVFQAGLKQLKEHGWLTPIGDSSQFNLNDGLLLMAAVVADPRFIVFTVREAPGRPQQLFLHYLAEPDIVELSTPDEKHYRLLSISDRPAMIQRILEMLGLPEIKAAPAAQFTVEEPVFLTVQDLVEHDQRDRAAALLKEQGVNGAFGDSLLSALQAADSGSLVVVVRPRGGEIVAGRKVTVFRQPDIAWLTRRVDTESNALKIETVQADTLPAILNQYFDFLAK